MLITSGGGTFFSKKISTHMKLTAHCQIHLCMTNSEWQKKGFFFFFSVSLALFIFVEIGVSGNVHHTYTGFRYMIMTPTGHCAGGAIKWHNDSWGITYAETLANAVTDAAADPAPSLHGQKGTNITTAADMLPWSLDDAPKLIWFVASRCCGAQHCGHFRYLA